MVKTSSDRLIARSVLIKAVWGNQIDPQDGKDNLVAQLHQLKPLLAEEKLTIVSLFLTKRGRGVESQLYLDDLNHEDLNDKKPINPPAAINSPDVVVNDPINPQRLTDVLIYGLGVVLRAPISRPIFEKHKASIRFEQLRAADDAIKGKQWLLQTPEFKKLDFDRQILPALFKFFKEFAEGDRRNIIEQNVESPDVLPLLGFLNQLDSESLKSLTEDLEAIWLKPSVDVS